MGCESCADLFRNLKASGAPPIGPDEVVLIACKDCGANYALYHDGTVRPADLPQTSILGIARQIDTSRRRARKAGMN
jgi:hypothetical protein